MCQSYDYYTRCLSVHDIMGHIVPAGQGPDMYLRKSKKKNGRVYLTIVEAYRDERGKNMSRTVERLG